MNTRLERSPLLVERFVQSLKQNFYADGTGRAYRAIVNEFIRYIEENERIDDFQQVDKHVIGRYRAHLYSDERDLGLASQSSHIIGLRSFFRWLEKEGHIFHDPTSTVDLPKRIVRICRDTFKEHEIDQLLSCIEIESKQGLRDKAMIELLYATGIRSGELCKLTVYDVEIENRVLRIRHGKGNKDRVLPVGEIAMGYIEEYLRHSRPKFMNAGKMPSLFVNRRGNPMKPGMIPRIVQKYAKRAGLKRYVCAHMIRHTTATHMLRHGANVRAVQALLGHESLATTQIYTHADASDLKRVHRATHPREIGMKSEKVSKRLLAAS